MDRVKVQFAEFLSGLTNEQLITLGVLLVGIVLFVILFFIWTVRQGRRAIRIAHEAPPSPKPSPPKVTFVEIAEIEERVVFSSGGAAAIALLVLLSVVFVIAAAAGGFFGAVIALLLWIVSSIIFGAGMVIGRTRTYKVRRKIEQ